MVTLQGYSLMSMLLKHLWVAFAFVDLCPFGLKGYIGCPDYKGYTIKCEFSSKFIWVTGLQQDTRVALLKIIFQIGLLVARVAAGYKGCII